MEVEIPETPRIVEHIIYLNYTSKSHVLTGKPSDVFRNEMKSLKLATYHPRLYPLGDASPISEKGWLVKRERLDELKELLKKHNISPKIVPAGIRPNSKERNTDVVVDEIRMALAAMGEKDVSDSPEASESSSDFDESLVKPVSKEEKAKIIEEIKECLDTSNESPEFTFKGTILPSGIGYGSEESFKVGFCASTFPGEDRGVIISHDFGEKITIYCCGVNINTRCLQIPYGEKILISGPNIIPTRSELRAFLKDYCSKVDNTSQFRLHQAMLLFEEKGDPELTFAMRCPELWNEMLTFWTY